MPIPKSWRPIPPQDEFWGFEFTGYAAQVQNFTTLKLGRLDQFEIDGNYTRGDFNGNLQMTVGQMANGAFNGQDASWWGVSALASEKLNTQWTLAGRADFGTLGHEPVGF